MQIKGHKYDKPYPGVTAVIDKRETRLREGNLIPRSIKTSRSELFFKGLDLTISQIS